jgi:hypothetical protein
MTQLTSQVIHDLYTALAPSGAWRDRITPLFFGCLFFMALVIYEEEREKYDASPDPVDPAGILLVLDHLPNK